MVSIGKPEIGLELCQHLGVKDGPDFIFAGKEHYCGWIEITITAGMCFYSDNYLHILRPRK